MAGYISTRNRGRKDVIHPVFQECIKLTDDEFWKSLYEDLSYGRYPKGIYIVGTNICNTNKRKFFSYNFSEKDPKEIVKEFRTLILENTNIYSSKDKKKKKKDIEKIKSGIQKVGDIEKFSSIKKKSVKEMLIINFVVEMKNKYSLSWNEARELKILINIGFIDKTLNSAGVVLENGRIKEIEGIEYVKSLGGFVNNGESKLKEEILVLGDNYMHKIWNGMMKKPAKKK